MPTKNKRFCLIPILSTCLFLFMAMIVLPNFTFAQGILYFPHIASNSTWETEICVINTSYEQSLTGELKAYDDAGLEVETKDVTLAFNARREVTIGSEFSTPERIGYVIFEYDSDSARGYTKFYIEGNFRVAIPAVSEINAGDIYISHIASDPSWWTGVSLLNTTNDSKELTIEFDDQTTKTISLAAKEHQVFAIKNLFGGIPQPNIGSAVIKNGNGVIGLELFGSSGAGANSYLSGILLKDDTTTHIYYPHIAGDSTWWTGIVAYNPVDSVCMLDITPYSTDGTALTPQTISLNPKKKYIGTANQLNFPPGTAWFEISASSPITGFELFGTTNGKQLGGYTGVNISGTNGVFAKIEDSGWTGIAFVNTENAPASVLMMAYDDNGDLIDISNLNLNAHQKIVGLAQNLFIKNISRATYIKFSSNREVVGFQLNGSPDGMLLDALQAMGGVGGPAVFSYDISFDEGASDPLTAHATFDEEPVTLPVTGLDMEGIYNTATQETTLNPDSTISVDGTDLMFGELDISVTQLVKWEGTDIPTQGAFEVQSGPDTIQLSINPDVGGGVSGVDVTFESNTVSFTWDDFDDLEEDPTAPAYLQTAGFALTSFEFVTEHIWYAFQAVQTIKVNETVLEAAGSNTVGLTETCERFPPQNGSSGTREFTWLDTNLSGDLNAGDGFEVAFNTDINGCWYDDPEDDIDMLINGTLELNQYNRDLDQFNNLTGMGADVRFDDFVEQETEEVNGEHIVLDDFMLTTEGGFNMMITFSN